QTIADVPLFSGMGLRIAAFVLIVGATIWYTWRYAKRVLADPSKSLIGVLDDENQEESLDAPFTGRHKLILSFAGIALAFFVFATIKMGWTINHMAAFFIFIGLVSGIIAGMNYNQLTMAFMEGCK